MQCKVSTERKHEVPIQTYTEKLFHIPLHYEIILLFIQVSFNPDRNAKTLVHHAYNQHYDIKHSLVSMVDRYNQQLSESRLL